MWGESSNHIWLFRILVVIAAIVALVSFIMPWWIGHFDTTHAIYIYGWGLRCNVLSLAPYVTGDVTPLWKVVLAWVYMGVSVGLAVYSTKLKKRWGSLMLGFIGSGLIAYAAVAINMVVKNRLAVFRIPLVGSVSVYNMVTIHAELCAGYYLAYIAGGILVVLAILRGLIMENQQKHL
jgi:hypothetical protein